MAPQKAEIGESAGNQDTVLDSSGTLVVRLARSQEEIEAAQRLRFDVFYREMHATATPDMLAAGRDFDEYDPVCEHLLAIDRANNDKVVGTYRLMRETAAAKFSKGFYTAGEYDVSQMLKARAGQRLLELGRSCVVKPFRTGPTMQLLWRGLLVYMVSNDIDLLFGCASLPGTDPNALKLQLSYLHHFHLAPEAERVRALPQLYTSMNLLPKESIDQAEALRALPPLVKGYLRPAPASAMAPLSITSSAPQMCSSTSPSRRRISVGSGT